MQEQAESIDTYITTLRALAETCDFGTLKDDLIRDGIVCGVRENGIRRKLLQESGLTLSKCVDICRANEATAAQLKALRRANSLNKKQTRSAKKKITRRRRHLDKMVKVQKISQVPNANTAVKGTNGKEISALHMEKPALHVENPTTLQQSVSRIPANSRRSVHRSLNARK